MVIFHFITFNVLKNTKMEETLLNWPHLKILIALVIMCRLQQVLFVGSSIWLNSCDTFLFTISYCFHLIFGVTRWKSEEEIVPQSRLRNAIIFRKILRLLPTGCQKLVQNRNLLINSRSLCLAMNYFSFLYSIWIPLMK